MGGIKERKRRRREMRERTEKKGEINGSEKIYFKREMKGING